MSPALRTALVWTGLLLLAIAIFAALGTPAPSLPPETFTADLAAGQVDSVEIDGNTLTVTRIDGDRYETWGFADPVKLAQAGVLVTWAESSWLLNAVLVGIPIVVLLAGLAWFVRRQQKQTGNTIFEMRKSKARKLKPGAETLKFSDIGGCADAKQRLGDVVRYLKDPKAWADAGVRMPRGVLLEGPPGCGKTLLARAVAGESHVPFFQLSASEFVEMFVGVGAARVRDLFETAQKAAPAVVFIDELDAVGRRRGSGVGSANDEREQTLNQLLVCMDGFDRLDRLVVIAATNRADVLDAALTRPGRFETRVTLPPLTLDERVATLGIHTRGKPLGDDVDLRALAARTDGWTGARLEHLANEAALHALRRANGVVQVAAEDFERSLSATKAAERFDAVDALLIESASQLAQPVAPARLRVELTDGSAREGFVVWADPAFVKLRDDDGRHALVPKSQVRTVHALEGTAAVEEAAIAAPAHAPEVA